MLAIQRWNRNLVYSSITPMLITLHWCQCHIVNQDELSTNNSLTTLFSVNKYACIVVLGAFMKMFHFMLKLNFCKWLKVLKHF